MEQKLGALNGVTNGPYGWVDDGLVDVDGGEAPSAMWWVGE